MRRAISLTGQYAAPDGAQTGLDPRSRQEFWQVVRGLAPDGAAVLLTTRRAEVWMIDDAIPAPGDPAWGFEEWVQRRHTGNDRWDWTLHTDRSQVTSRLPRDAWHALEHIRAPSPPPRPQHPVRPGRRARGQFLDAAQGRQARR